MATKRILSAFNNLPFHANLVHSNIRTFSSAKFINNILFKCDCIPITLIATRQNHSTSVLCRSVLITPCWSSKCLSTGAHPDKLAQTSRSPIYQATEIQKDVEVDKETTGASAFARLKEIQTRQKRLVERPQETEPTVIYTGLLSQQMKRLKVFSLTTSIMGVALQPILFMKSSEVPLPASVAMMSMVAFFTVGTPFLINVIAKKYVTEMIYDPSADSYTAITYTFFLKKKEISFKMEDVIVPDVPGPFTTFTVKTKDGKVIPYFVALECFLNKTHYGRLMGYDKPINLNLTINKDTKPEKKADKHS